MNTGWTPETLIAFEQDICETFNRGEIKAPVHLSGGNETQLIDIFKHVQPNDWKCGTWRFHYHSLLSGVPPEELKQSIVAGRSIALCFPSARVICSAMVGGVIPLALGLAWAVKRLNGRERVWCFIGDMAETSGIASECSRYAAGFDLPLTIVVEDNGKSVSTDTQKSWGGRSPVDVADIRYSYELTWPHVGSGRWVHMQ